MTDELVLSPAAAGILPPRGSGGPRRRRSLVSGSVLGLVPFTAYILLFLALQRYYIRGMLAGSVKG